MCETIREEFKMQKIIFMPAKVPPHKDASHIIDADDRLQMVKLAISGNPYFEVSQMEMKREGASYTVDTLKSLHEIYGPDEKIGLIIGADSLVNLKTWRKFPVILSLAKLIVASRPDTDERRLDDAICGITAEFDADIAKSEAEAMNYSSTEIRERVKKGLSIRYRVPPAVEAYIYENGLYR
jgi:nicotinate-nucleotide adenylyltransferase